MVRALSTGSRLLGIGRLLRLSLAPSALADGAAGLVLAGGVWPGGAAPWLLLGANACIYHGGMVLNDWADRSVDAVARPERPLPAGILSAPSALVLGVVLLAVGLILGFRADPQVGGLFAALTACVVLYDLVGRGPFLGPLLLGFCRAANLGTGLLLGIRLSAQAANHTRSDGNLLLLLPPLLYGGYVFCVSRLGRLEDRKLSAVEAQLPPRLLRRAGLLLLALGALVPVLSVRAIDLPRSLPGLPWSALVLALGLAGLGATGLFRAAGGMSWRGADIVQAMGLCLRRLLILTAIIALGAGTWDGVWVAGGVLLGYPASFWLRRAFPPS